MRGTKRRRATAVSAQDWLMRIHLLRYRFLPLLMLLAVGLATAQSAPNDAAQMHGGHVLLVLPFENRSGQTSLDWVGEAFPVIMNQRLAASGYMPLTRDDRMYAMDHLGLPENFKPTHATTLRIAQTLGADYVIFGSFKSADGRINATAQTLDVKALRLLPEMEDSTPMQRLMDLANAMAWKMAMQLDPHLNVAEETFVAASAGLRLDAFEMYVRGVMAAQSDESIADLVKSVQLAPEFALAELALGKAYFATENYSQAAQTLAQVPRKDPRSLEAGFYAGLADLYLGHYPQAQQSFDFVAGRLPLPEVVNNEGVAESRAGKNAVAFYTRAMAADPGNEDYVYNLAVTLRRNGDKKNSLEQVQAALKLKPGDADAVALKNSLTAAAASTDSFQPLERIERTWQEASYRQAAFELEEMRAMRLAMLPAAQQSAERVRQGEEYLGEGQTLEAEHEFQAALAVEANGDSAAAAHAGMAAVRAQNGSQQEARNEATASLALRPNVNALLVLARLDLAANDLNACASEIQQALQLEPRNAAVLGMAQALETRGKHVQ